MIFALLQERKFGEWVCVCRLLAVPPYAVVRTTVRTVCVLFAVNGQKATVVGIGSRSCHYFCLSSLDSLCLGRCRCCHPRNSLTQ